MGLLILLFGSKKSNQNNKDNHKNEQPRNYSELKQKTQELKASNIEWGKHSSKIISLREKAIELERNKKNEEAIKVYLESIGFGEESKRLSIYHYAHDINRVIILYSKGRKLELLKEFLNRNIYKYPDYNRIEKWKVRLSKLDKK